MKLGLKNLTFQRIWEENRKFLLIAGGGLALFLILYGTLVENYKAGAAEIREDNSRMENRVRELHRQVRDGYWKEKNLLDDYVEVEKDLLARLGSPEPKDLPGERSGSTELFFSGKIDGLWGEIYPKARDINCELPEKLSVQELGVVPGDTPLDNMRHARYLEVLRRALNALVDSGMRRIEKPQVQREEALEIRGNVEHQIVYQRVAVTAHGSYDSFVRLLRECQKPGRFLRVLIRDLNARGPGGADVLRGTLEFSSFYIEEVEAEEAAGADSQRPPLIRRRRP